MFFQASRGFTLLELLIVVAIIGLLSTITIDYIGESRQKGTDAAVQKNLLNARSQAEVYFANTNESYEGVCNAVSNGIFRHMRAAAQARNLPISASYTDAEVGDATNEVCHDSQNAYAAWVPLEQGGGICIDSRNTTRIGGSGLPANQFACP